MKKLANIFEFYKSTLIVNFAVCLVAFLFGNLQTIPYVFISFGFILSLVFKEVYRKNDYLFYKNNGFSKMELYGFTCLFNLILSTIVFLLYERITNLF